MHLLSSHFNILNFQIRPDGAIKKDELGCTLPQRRWAKLSLSQEVSIVAYVPDSNSYLYRLQLEVQLFKKQTDRHDRVFDTDQMSRVFLQVCETT